MAAFITVALIILELVFGLLFFVLSFLSVVQLIRAQSSKEQNLLNKQPKQSLLVSMYYAIQTILCLGLSAYLEIFAIEAILNPDPNLSTDDFKNKCNSIFNNGTYITDSIFFVLFCFIFSQMVIYNQYAHIRYGNMLKDSSNIVNARIFQININIKLLMIVYIVVQILVIGLYNTQFIGGGTLNYIDFSFNVSLPVMFIIYAIYNFRNFSGSPFRSQKAEINIKSLEMILIFFSVGRVIQCMNNLFMALNQNVIYNIMVSGQNKVTIIMIIQLVCIFIDLLFCQLMPIAFTLQDKYVQILSITFEEDKLLILDKESISSGSEITTLNCNLAQHNEIESKESVVVVVKNKYSITDHKDRTIIQINAMDIDFIESFQQASSSPIQLGNLSLASVKQGKYQDKKFIVRTLQVKRLSQYLIEEMNRSIQEYRNLSCPQIQTIKAVSFDKDNVFFFTPYFIRGNLYQFINQQSVLDTNLKKKLLLQICEGMTYLYQQIPLISHGHLTPNNIMITPDDNIKIIDFGLSAIKKYLSLTTGYTTKCQYSSPEQLKDRSLTPSFSQESDVYAFGVIAWEIYHQKLAFKGSSLNELIHIIGQENKRPKIDTSIESQIAIIIRACWQDDKTKRPKFDLIMKTLQGNETLSFDIVDS